MYTTDHMDVRDYVSGVVQQPSGTYGNRVLDALSPSALEGLAPILEQVTLQRREELVHPHEDPRYVYFPVSCVISWLSTLHSGATIEVATIGNEGVVGSPLIHGGARFPFLVMNQVAGVALRTPVETFRAAVRTNRELAAVLEVYSHAFLVQVAQSGACNGLHGVGARCARWLLMTQDRVGSAAFSMTHELLADMLGAARPTVTEAIGELHARGAVRSSAGQVQVLDRTALEAASCECYAIIAAAYESFGVAPEA